MRRGNSVWIFAALGALGVFGGYQERMAAQTAAAPAEQPAPMTVTKRAGSSQVAASARSAINLPTSKRLMLPAPGAPQRVNSFPVTLTLSPDGRYAVTMNNGYGTAESGNRQSLTVLDLQTNQLTDYPDERLGLAAHQSYFMGLVFSSDGRRLFASVGSITDPTGGSPGATGNGIAVYRFEQGKISPSAFWKLPLQPLGAGKMGAAINRHTAKDKLIPYPAGLAHFAMSSAEFLLVAENLSDDVLLLDANSGNILKRFDVSTEKIVPGAYPYAVAVARDGQHAWVSLWNASRVAELDLAADKVSRMIALRAPESPIGPGSHPTALLLSPDEKHLYVTLANTDEVGVIDTADGTVDAYMPTALPGQEARGAYPVALAQSADGKTIYAANAGTNTVAVIGVAALLQAADAAQPVKPPRPRGFIPTEWYPQGLALATETNQLLIACGKGRGTGSNGQHIAVKRHGRDYDYPYIFSLLAGSLARVDLAQAEPKLALLTQQAQAANLLRVHPAGLGFAHGVSPIKHVIYIIKENRTYDQVFGDIKEANGDPSLTMYGEDITPNQHKLARSFGILDNFYDSGEVSGDGHNWSTAAIGSDYLEKTIQIAYRDSSERTYDFEGEVANRFPMEDEMPDVNEPGTGYLWGNVARHGLSYRHYGEFVATRWCNRPASMESPKQGTPSPAGATCERKEILKGEPLPSGLGQPPGSASPWPWAVPLIAENVATKPELRGHFDAGYADFNLAYPDQLRADEFLNEFAGFVQARKTHKGDELPNYVLLRLPNDHTSGTRPGSATPSAAVADNDLAVGRVVEAVSHSDYWNDTAILVLEDDAQDGPDHVDAHRSIALVISKYSPSSLAHPLVDHNFSTTVGMIHTLEGLLGLPPMNSNDAYAPVIARLFSGSGHHAPFEADYRNRDNGLLYQTNAASAPGAKASAAMDFSEADRADAALLNQILWRDRMGDRAMPGAGNGLSNADEVTGAKPSPARE